MENRRFRWILPIVIAGSLIFSLISEIDYYLTPHISEVRYHKLIAAGKFIKENGWKEPILVSYGDPGIWFWSLDRTYLGAQVGQLYTYYGKLQELYHLAPPLNESSYRTIPDTELVTATRNAIELGTRFGNDIGALRDHPVVLFVPESYNRPISEALAARYHIGDGVFVIPPGALQEIDINRWLLFGAFDDTWRTGGYVRGANWSIAPQVLEVFDLSPDGTFAVYYRFGTSVWTSYTVRVRLMDFPSLYNSSSPYSPLLLSVDGVPILTHSYNGTGPVWLTAQTDLLDQGMHVLEVRTGGLGTPIILSFDVIQIEPS